MSWQPPEGHPISIKRARELIAGDLGDVQRDILKRCCLPIYWFDLDNADAGILHNATLTLVQTGERLMAITADHVLSALDEDRRGRRIRLQFMNAVVDDIEIIDRSERLDLATIAIEPRILREVGKDTTPLQHWPPRAPQEGGGIMLAGYPGVERLEPGRREVNYGLFTVLGIARRVTDEQITWRVDREFAIEHPAIPQPPPAYDTGGISGGPLIGWFESSNYVTHYCLSGIVSQAHRELENIVAKRADFIRVDGSIRNPA